MGRNLPEGLSTTDYRSPLFDGCAECGNPDADKSPCEGCHEEHYRREAERRQRE